MKITKRQLRRIIRESLNEQHGHYSPDEDFSAEVESAAIEAHRQAQTIDGPKGRAAKKLYTDMLKDEVRKQEASGVDPKRMRKIINDTWKNIHR
jgi:hypothetical protein